MNAPLYYPNHMGRIILQAMEEIIGRNGVSAVLNLSGLMPLIEHYPPVNLEPEIPFSTISQLQLALEAFYGPHGGRGVALRVGRACFQRGMRELLSEKQIVENSFRLLPLKAKIKAGADVLAGFINKVSDQRVSWEDTGSEILWKTEHCPYCWQRHTDSPSCHLDVGFLQEAFYWMSGGKFYRVEETQCVACGDPACVILIDKQPMG